VNNSVKVVSLLFGIMVLLAVVNPTVRANSATYLIIGITLVATFLLNMSSPGVASSFTERIKAQKKRGEEDKLSEKERKLLMFYILTRLEKRDVLDMNDLMSELDVSIYELNNLIKFLAGHNAINVIYPPMQNFPILRRGNQDVSAKIRMGIFNAISKHSVLGEDVMENFANEVADYIEGMKRPSKK
jgi:hypothetical protein